MPHQDETATAGDREHRYTSSFLNASTPMSSNLSRYLSCNAFLAEGKRVLDIGCGEGFLMNQAATLGAAQVYGIDISRDAIEKSREFVPMAKAEVISVTDYDKVDDFLGERVDLYLCNPAQIPLPAPLSNGYFVGTDGRTMVDTVIDFLKQRMRAGDRAILTGHTLSDWQRTVQAFRSEGQFEAIVHSFRDYPLYDSIAKDADNLRHIQETRPEGLREEDGTKMIQSCLIQVTCVK